MARSSHVSVSLRVCALLQSSFHRRPGLRHYFPRPQPHSSCCTRISDKRASAPLPITAPRLPVLPHAGASLGARSLQRKTKPHCCPRENRTRCRVLKREEASIIKSQRQRSSRSTARPSHPRRWIQQHKGGYYFPRHPDSDIPPKFSGRRAPRRSGPSDVLLSALDSRRCRARFRSALLTWPACASPLLSDRECTLGNCAAEAASEASERGTEGGN